MAKNALLLLWLWVVLIAMAFSSVVGVGGARHGLTGARMIRMRPGILLTRTISVENEYQDPDEINTDDLDEENDPCAEEPCQKTHPDCTRIDLRCKCSRDLFPDDDDQQEDPENPEEPLGVCVLHPDMSTDSSYEKTTTVTDTSATSDSGGETSDQTSTSDSNASSANEATTDDESNASTKSIYDADESGNNTTSETNDESSSDEINTGGGSNAETSGNETDDSDASTIKGGNAKSTTEE